MKKIVFTEEFCQPENLFPFNLTRRIQDIRMGIMTIREKWETGLGMRSFDRKAGDYKDHDASFILDKSISKDVIYLIHGNIIPDNKLIRQVKKLKSGEFISVPGREAIVYCISIDEIEDPNRIKVKKAIEFADELKEIKYPWDIFQMNQWALEQDFNWMQKHRKPHHDLPDSNQVTNRKNIFIEKSARVEYCTINASEGPVYIGKNALVMEGSMLRGPVSIGAGAVVKMGTRIYGATTIGPGCVVGGRDQELRIFWAFQ